nr:2-amino-4-hydroxy-6-hydroxymethyldihydropteridine diphosphokinase [Desulfobacterales bacterium]
MDFRHTAYIGIGSNLGNKKRNCLNGIEAIEGDHECCVETKSPLYLTEPVDFEDQAWFVNGVIKICTCLDPVGLLNRLKGIEKKAGRVSSGIKFGPRILDLDILFFDELILNTEYLTLPHPRLHKRRFVLRPLFDIEPDLIHPVLKKNIRTLLLDLKDGGRRIILFE